MEGERRAKTNGRRQREGQNGGTGPITGAQFCDHGNLFCKTLYKPPKMTRANRKGPQ